MRLTTRTTVLWTAQVLLAALFAFAGVAKLTMPADVLAAQSGMSAGFLRFIGAAELLGAFGLILPGLFRIYQVLTPLAAAGLVIIMVGATVITLGQGFAPALMPLTAGLIAAYVTYGRARPFAAA